MGLSRPAQGSGPFFHIEDPADGAGQKQGLCGGVEESLFPVLQQSADPAHMGGHAGHSQEHGLAQGVGRILHGGGQGEDVALQEFPLHSLRAQEAQKFDFSFQSVGPGVPAQIPVIGLLL